MICRDSNNSAVLTSYQAEVAHAKQQLHSVYTKLEECERSVENGREEVEQVSYLLNYMLYLNRLSYIIIASYLLSLSAINFKG